MERVTIMGSAITSLTSPKRITVNSSEFRGRLKSFLRRIKGHTVVEITTARDNGERKCVNDGEYFDELLNRLQGAIDTAEITSDPKAYAKLLRAASTIDEDLRHDRLHSFEEAFTEE